MTIKTEQQFHDSPAHCLSLCLNGGEAVVIESAGFLRPAQGQRLAVLVPLDRLYQFPDLIAEVLDQFGDRRARAGKPRKVRQPA